MTPRSGGNILIESLRAHGVRKMFCVPGESYLDALDALTDAQDIRVVTCRQEGGAGFMAEAYAKLTGKTGVCFVTRGPGACNASIGVHTAMQDSTPMILLVGQVARDQKGKEAFQEVEYRDMFKPPFTKWASEVTAAGDLPAVMEQAFDIAHSGRPGPVVIALPEDVLTEMSSAAVQPPRAAVRLSPTHGQLAAMNDMLATAQRPMAIIGGGCWDDAAMRDFAAFCEESSIPVVTSFRRQDMFDNDRPCYAGHLGTTFDAELAKAVQEADLLLAVGTRLGEISTQGYTLVASPQPRQKLIHVYPDAGELNKVYKSDVAVLSGVREFSAAVAAHPVAGEHRRAWVEKLNARYRAWSEVKSRDKFQVDLDGVIEDIINALPEDAVITTDAGNFSGWPQRYVRYKRPMRLLAPTSGAMGYGVPAAVAASLTHPDRAVVGFMGDGGFMMTAQEIATAVHEGAHPVLLVFNNGMYGTIRMHQEKHYPKRVSATDLTNPDFAAFARSFGVDGVTVTKTEDFLPAFKKALEAKRATVIEIRMDREQITTAKKLSEL